MVRGILRGFMIRVPTAMTRFVRLTCVVFALMSFTVARAQSVPDAPLRALPQSPGLDVEAMDTRVDPCENFYQYSCGGWRTRNPIPGDQPGWDVYNKLAHENQRFLWGLLEDAAAERADRSASEQKIGDYFAACMKEDAIEAAGMAPLKPLLERIDAMQSSSELPALLAHLHGAGVGNALFHFSAEQDLADSSRVIAALDAGGLGLKDRDQYLKGDAKSKELRSAYVTYLERMFDLLGRDAASARADARVVMRIETALARSSLTLVQRRDPRALHHPMRLNELRALSPAMDFGNYLAARGVQTGAVRLNVTQPAFLRRVSALAAQRPLEEWKAYLRVQAAIAWSPYLASPFAQAHFDFYSRTLRGVQQMPARWLQCVRWVDRDLGEALGQVFVAKTFSADTRSRVTDMTRRIQAAMEQRIRELDWMSTASKQAALEKLHAIVNKIGYPERWRDYSALAVGRDDFFANVSASLAFEDKRQLAKIGRPVDRDEWLATPPTVNAFYNPQLNDINFPAGVLQPPLFDPRMDDAPNYGNTGATIGHELTHAFDDEGRQFDAKGNLRDWWGPKDGAEFARRSACIVEQFGRYIVIDDLRINSKLTLGEDIADLGGAILAYIAWKQATADQLLTERDGLTPDQRFFVGMAQWACSNERPENQRLSVLTEPHSPPQYRVNGLVANMPEFAKAFACKPKQAMVNPKPCRVW